MSKLDDIRDTKGKLPAYAWPGGYPIWYLTRDGMIICPDCANREIDDAQAVTDYDINWEDDALYCEDCGKHIESAYGEDEEVET